jgi:uncharacterized protein HemX
MNDRQKDDGLLVGILVILLVLLVGGLGLGGFMFARVARVREMEARIAVERALVAEQQARAAAEAMRAQAEAARTEAHVLLNRADGPDKTAPPGELAATVVESATPSAEERLKETRKP